MGGVETHCEQLYPRLAALGHDVTVVRRSRYATRDIDSWQGVKIVTIPSSSRKSLEAIVHTFRAILRARRLKAQILHIHAVGPALLTPLARLLGMKVVFTHHGPDYDRDKWGRLAKVMLRLGERMGCAFANDVIVISDVIRRLIATRCGRTQRVHLIYNGVPQAQPCDFPEYFAQLGIEPGEYILGMCRLVPEKNLHHLIEACGKIDMRGCKLVIAGDTDFEDDYSRSLKETARRQGVILTGFIKGQRLHSLLTHCRCYCLPSSHEGLPIALLEAMSYNIPVIASDIPANLEVGLPEACYFTMGDVNALAQKLQAIVNSEPRAVSYDMKRYNWDTIAAQVDALYRSLM